MGTARDRVTGALVKIGAIAGGETPSAEDLSIGLSALNLMFGSWSSRGLIVPARVREEFTLVSGTQSYTIGTGGVFNTTRPVSIEAAAIEDQASSPNYEIPINVFTIKQWAEILQKDMSADHPQGIFLAGTTPLQTIYVWPKPSAAHKLVLYSWKALTSVVAADSIDLPPGYDEAIEWNLAERLCPSFGKMVTVDINRFAKEGMANIQSLNTKSLYLKCDPAVVRSSSFNIYTGGYN